MMAKLIGRRAFSLLLSLIAASVAIFMVVEILPGDPAEIMGGMNATPEQLDTLRHQYGLDVPAVPRYLQWISGVVTGNLGISYSYNVPVLQLVQERLEVSVPLAAMAIAISVLLAFPVGMYTALRNGGWSDALLMGVMQVWVAVPSFLLGLIFIFGFSVSLRLFPGSGFPGWEEGAELGLKALVLPAFVLALPQSAILSRVLRSSLLDVLSEDYIRTARAKGLSRFKTVWSHAIRNSLPPVLTILGLQFSFLVGGAIVVESVFSLPGIGRLMIQALNQRDLVVVESVGLLLVAGVILVSFLVDFIMLAVDPRLRRPG
ncbi:MAG: ABC transporter permease [Methylobacteriaceae bacterium]|jgi:peptide/nickel transport system permease protein|nr:ABC transporter permease [Methylobacteriaceae bacterium]